MEVTRNIILDLLPLYTADEASADTRALVEKFLETDPELAKIAKESAVMELKKAVPVPLTREDQLKAYVRAKRRMWLFTLLLAALMAGSLVAVLAFFFISSP